MKMILSIVHPVVIVAAATVLFVVALSLAALAEQNLSLACKVDAESGSAAVEISAAASDGESAVRLKLLETDGKTALAGDAPLKGASAADPVQKCESDGTSRVIRNGSFDDLYPGDYWNLPIDGGTTALIVGCNCYCVTYSAEGQINLPNSNLCVWLKNNSWKFPMNDTDTCAGHLKGSKLYNETFPALVAKLEAVLPSGSLRESTHWITDSINANGVPNHMVIDKMKLFLPSRHNLGVMPGRSSRNSAYQGQEQILWPYSLFHKTPLWAFFWLDTTYDATQWECAFDSRWGDTFPIKASLVRTVWPYCYIG